MSSLTDIDQQLDVQPLSVSPPQERTVLFPTVVEWKDTGSGRSGISAVHEETEESPNLTLSTDDKSSPELSIPPRTRIISFAAENKVYIIK